MAATHCPIVGLVTLTAGCNANDVEQLGPGPLTTQAKLIASLWQGAWIAALASARCVGPDPVGRAVHRKRGDRIPHQVRYNLPIEIIYTVIPFIMVGVLFYFTARDENCIDALSPHPDVVVEVTGFQWSWHFQTADPVKNSATAPPRSAMWNGEPALRRRRRASAAGDPRRRDVGFDLRSNDVVHSFWILPFDFKRDVSRAPEQLPGDAERDAQQRARHHGRCSELCGLYHSRMLFRSRSSRGTVQDVDPGAAGAAERTGCSVTTYETPALVLCRGVAPTYRKGSILVEWLSSTDHKVIGHLYLITSFFFFLAGGLMAMIMRAELMGPDNHIVSDQQYNELFTMHGTIMLLLFATPLFVGFANEIMPLQIGAPDVAFPRLNLFSY